MALLCENLTAMISAKDGEIENLLLAKSFKPVPFNSPLRIQSYEYPIYPLLHHIHSMHQLEGHDQRQGDGQVHPLCLHGNMGGKGI